MQTSRTIQTIWRGALAVVVLAWIGAGVAAAQEALGPAALPYLALLLEAGSQTMRGNAAVGQALVLALDDKERAFVRVAGWKRPPSRRRLEDVLARLVSTAVDAAT